MIYFQQGWHIIKLEKALRFQQKAQEQLGINVQINSDSFTSQTDSRWIIKLILTAKTIKLLEET